MIDEPRRLPPIVVCDAQGQSLLDMPAVNLAPAHTLAVTGPSGAGKSLWLKSLFGFGVSSRKPHFHPEQGDFLMIQDPSRGLSPHLTVGQHYSDIGQNTSEFVDILAHLDLDKGFLSRKPHQLSGGEAQRILLAMLLVQHPRTLVCDEPAASLDTDNEDRVIRLLSRAQKKWQFSLIFVTHQCRLIASFADEALVMVEGRSVFLGEKSAFFERPVHPFHRGLIDVYRREEPAPGTPSLSEKTRPLLDLDRVSVTLGKVPILDSCSWQVNAGSWWWLIGSSGSGKSTLAHLIGGLLVPYRGRMEWDGAELGPLNTRSTQVKRAIQLVFQYGTLCFNPVFSVKRQLGWAFGDDDDRLGRYLDQAELGHLELNRRPSSFSLGEMQRLNVVRALGTRPRLLVCDEIFNALDINLRFLILNLLDGYQKEEGAALILISHDHRLVDERKGEILMLPR